MFQLPVLAIIKELQYYKIKQIILRRKMAEVQIFFLKN